MCMLLLVFIEDHLVQNSYPSPPAYDLTLYKSQRVQTGSRPADHNGLGRVEKAVINSHPLQAV